MKHTSTNKNQLTSILKAYVATYEIIIKSICCYIPQLRALLRDKYEINKNPFTEKKTMLRKAMGTST